MIQCSIFSHPILELGSLGVAAVGTEDEFVEARFGDEGGPYSPGTLDFYKGSFGGKELGEILASASLEIPKIQAAADIRHDGAVFLTDPHKCKFFLHLSGVGTVEAPLIPSIFLWVSGKTQNFFIGFPGGEELGGVLASAIPLPRNFFVGKPPFLPG